MSRCLAIKFAERCQWGVGEGEGEGNFEWQCVRTGSLVTFAQRFHSASPLETGSLILCMSTRVRSGSCQ